VLGAALVTTISPGVAHLAQLAVHPSVRGRGIAGTLTDDAIHMAALGGCHRMTLLVEHTSAAAMRIYAARGFAPREHFIAAWLPLAG
jgi:ribosomal protein S18 acetylase RimI-like enzyme